MENKETSCNLLVTSDYIPHENDIVALNDDVVGVFDKFVRLDGKDGFITLKKGVYKFAIDGCLSYVPEGCLFGESSKIRPATDKEKRLLEYAFGLDSDSPANEKTKDMKSFKDLVFVPHEFSSIADDLKGKIPPQVYENMKESKQAVLHFPNGYGISVVIGKNFYSNGVDTYEIAILKGYDICPDTGIGCSEDSPFYWSQSDGVIGNLTAYEVSKVMRIIQELPA